MTENYSPLPGPTPSDPATDTKSKALTVCDMLIQKGLSAELDQIEVTSGLCALAAARFMAANGLHDRGRRVLMRKNIVKAFEARLKIHLANVGDPAAK